MIKLTVAGIGIVCALAGTMSEVRADVLFANGNDNGFFVPYTSSFPSTRKYGDSGWLSNFQAQGYDLTKITLGMTSFNNAADTTADITITINDGDPSGFVFGSGTQLYTTTITNVFIPASPSGGVAHFSLPISLPNVQTSGGFNNVGWSVSVSNFGGSGSLGFQCSSTLSQFAGFYTNNASYFDGTSWSLFSFNPNDPVFGVANFVATIEGTLIPSPGGAGVLLLSGMIAGRRRR